MNNLLVGIECTCMQAVAYAHHFLLDLPVADVISQPLHAGMQKKKIQQMMIQ